MSGPYEFDRYVDGQLMAEGARIHHAASVDEARAKAIALFTPGAKEGEMEHTVFKWVGYGKPPK